METKDFKDIIICIVNNGAIIRPRFFNYDQEQLAAKIYFTELKRCAENFGGRVILQSFTADDLRS